MCWYSLWNFKWRRFPSSITGDMIPTIIIHWSQQKQNTSSCGGWVFTFLSVVVSDGTMMLATTFYATKDLPLTCPMSPAHLKHFLLMLSKFFSSSPGSTIDGSMVDLIIVYMWEFHLPQPIGMIFLSFYKCYHVTTFLYAQWALLSYFLSTYVVYLLA